MTSEPLHTAAAADVDWSRWTVVLLKPDCVARGLVDEVLAWVGCEVRVVDQRTVTVTEAQIFAHYADIIATADRFASVDVHADLRRIYVGRHVVIALGHGPNAPPRVRVLLGHYDPSRAGADTIRGHYGIDSYARARAERRLIDNLIHTSDDPAGAAREFDIWYGPSARHLLRTPDR